MSWKAGRLVVRRVPYNLCKGTDPRKCEIILTNPETGDEIRVCLQEIRSNTATISISTSRRNWLIQRAENLPGTTEEDTDGKSVSREWTHEGEGEKQA